jgi:hypothetical protein
VADRDWWFHWDKARVHTATMVPDWMVARQFQVIQHPPYLPELILANLFLFSKVKKELAGLTLTRRPSRRSGMGESGLCWWLTLPRPSGGGMSAAKNVYMYIAGFYIEKELKINIPLPTTVFLGLLGIM